MSLSITNTRKSATGKLIIVAIAKFLSHIVKKLCTPILIICIASDIKNAMPVLIRKLNSRW